DSARRTCGARWAAYSMACSRDSSTAVASGAAVASASAGPTVTAQTLRHEAFRRMCLLERPRVTVPTIRGLIRVPIEQKSIGLWEYRTRRAALRPATVQPLQCYLRTVAAPEISPLGAALQPQLGCFCHGRSDTAVSWIPVDPMMDAPERKGRTARRSASRR